MEVEKLREWIEAGNDVNQMLPRFNDKDTPKTSLLIAVSIPAYSFIPDIGSIKI